MMKRLTKRQALQGCYDMWKCISETGCSKGTWISDHPEFDYLVHDCFACEYYTQQEDLDENDTCVGLQYVCSGKCVLNCIWPYGCEVGDSPYLAYKEVTNPSFKKRYAKIIADAAKAELDKLEEE